MPVGSGLVAAAAIPRGTIVHSWAGSAILPRPTYQSVQVGRRRHAHDPECLNLLNHSCEPNLTIDIPGRAVVALRDVLPGEILTYFYPSTEWDMARPFRCRCGSPRCIRLVRGAKYLTPALLEAHPVSRHIRALLRELARPRSRRVASGARPRAGRRGRPATSR